MIQDMVTVKRSKRAKRVALRLDPVERVVNLIVPSHMPLNKAYKFAQNHEEWVQQTLDNLAPPIPFANNTKLSIFGDTIRLSINKDTNLKRTTIQTNENTITVNTYLDNPTNRITAYLKKLAKTGLADIASDKADIINRKISSISVKDTKSRWGSCSQNAELSFSWRLVFAPYNAIDYVVAHEVAHLIHMNHSESFWKLCEQLSCNYQDGKYWMKNHGNELMRYGKS